MSYINTWMYRSRGMQEQLPSGSMAITNKAADDLKLLLHFRNTRHPWRKLLEGSPEGANQRAQLCVLAVRHGTTMASQRRLDLNALVCAGPLIQS